MPSTIPYDPSLMLGSVVNQKAASIVQQIAAQQSKADAAEQHFRALYTQYQNASMKKAEFESQKLPTTRLEAAMQSLGIRLDEAAAAETATKTSTEEAIVPLREQLRTVHVEVESPVDYLQTQIKTLPLGADSVNMDVQFFTIDTNEQQSLSMAQKISNFVAGSTKMMGSSFSSQMSRESQRQVAQQYQSHQVMGTLVISVTCTHQNAKVLAPFVFNVDKAIKVYNNIASGRYEKAQSVIKSGSNMQNDGTSSAPSRDLIIDTHSRESMLQAINDMKQANYMDKQHQYSIISGMSLGSSFIGMVHMLNSTETANLEALENNIKALQGQANLAGWFEDVSGGFGLNESLGANLKSLLSTQKIQSHVTMICMGAVPSIKSTELKMGVAKFADFDPKATIEAIAVLANSSNADQASIAQSAEAARTGQKMLAMKSSDIKAALSTLGAIDDGKNKVLDTNSMITALEDYLQKVQTGQAGVPINYFLKDITKEMLVEMWVDKYFPQDTTIPRKYDDSPSTGKLIPKTGGPAEETAKTDEAKSTEPRDVPDSGGQPADSNEGTQ